MPSPRPRLSVAIPTYNGADFLETCLRSVLAQEDVDLEVHVGDDASTDDTREVARSIADPRLHVHAFPERLGLAGNWNRTRALARGDYFALVGQDDWVAPDWARRLVGLLESHPRADLAFGRRDFAFADAESRRVLGDFFENRYPEMLAPFYAEIGELIEPEAMLAAAMRHLFEINLIGEPSFVVVRTANPAFAQGFDENLGQMIDWEFFTRFFVDRPLVHCPNSVGTYHIHSRASSFENAPLSKHYRELDYLLGLILERFAGMLGTERAQALRTRREEARELQVTWTTREK